MNVFKATKMYTYRWLKWQIACCTTLRKNYSKATEIKTVWNMWKDRCIDQWDKKKSVQMRPINKRSFDFHKVAKVKGENIAFFNK